MTIPNLSIDSKGIIQSIWKGPSPNMGGELSSPTLLANHYTASGGVTGSGDVSYLSNPAAKASAHCVIGRAGDITQIVPFTRQAWHAGVSIWRGRSGCNAFSIGIEYDNWGYLNQTMDFKYKSHSGTEVPSDRVIKAQHKNPAYAQLQWWETYTSEQIEAGIALTRAILDKYPTILEIVGHEDVSPGRKSDPGPAFPWNHFLSATQDRGDSTTFCAGVAANVNASILNVRGGPGTEYKVLGQLVRGTSVLVEYDVPGDWTQIAYKGGVGFVADRYLSLAPR